MASLQERLAEFDPDLPLEEARTLPAGWYQDEEIARLERELVFGDSWQLVGRAEQVAGPGSYLTFEVAGEPILVVRDEEGELRAFANVCRHRAARVMTDPCGQATRLRCRYHGWTYDLAGRLRGTPDFDGVRDFLREENGLMPLAVGVWGPWVWVHGGTSPAPLGQVLEPLARHGVLKRIAGLRWVRRREYELACDWKVFVDNYLDGGYHISTVHPGLASVISSSGYRALIEGLTSVQLGPLTAGNSDHEEVSRVRRGDEAQYWWVYPGVMLNITEGVMDTNVVLPLGPGRCRVIFDFYFAATDGEEAGRFIDASIAVSDRVQQEDVEICEEVQKGLGSRTYSTGRFSVKREGPGYHFHQLLGRRLRQATR